jgi:hypothetical protein
MKPISNLKVYDLKESLVASGYPMMTDVELRGVNQKDIKRAIKLTKASINNNAHVQFLTGIRVNFDLTFTNKAWVEAERYRFLEFVSSQSTMHRITRFNIDNQYCKYVDSRVVEIMKEKIKEYNEIEDSEEKREKYLEILYTNPSGFKITARMTTNYRCLLNIYNQRHDHRLPEWRAFCEQIKEELPLFKDLIEVLNIEKKEDLDK